MCVLPPSFSVDSPPAARFQFLCLQCAVVYYKQETSFRLKTDTTKKTHWEILHRRGEDETAVVTQTDRSVACCGSTPPLRIRSVRYLNREVTKTRTEQSASVGTGSTKNNCLTCNKRNWRGMLGGNEAYVVGVGVGVGTVAVFTQISQYRCCPSQKPFTTFVYLHWNTRCGFSVLQLFLPLYNKE